ncbi:MAG: hypothetical protein HY704_14845 [Gemmatimonadetes bacterium]|nr:hypothetical protein [Gemmatimonadota bacterium]
MTRENGDRSAHRNPAPDLNEGDRTGAHGHADQTQLPPDATLGGYLREHSRPPAFEGIDGQPYTVSIEVERTGELQRPYLTYLVFPRWAYTGLGIVGHVESAIVARTSTREEAQERAEGLTLYETKQLLDEAILRRARGDLDKAPDEELPDDRP